MPKKNVAVSMSEETLDAIVRIGRFRSPNNPLTRSQVIRELVEEEERAMAAMPCHHDVLHAAPEAASALCPHGFPVVDCTACYVAGDLAFDADREGR